MMCSYSFLGMKLNSKLTVFCIDCCEVRLEESAHDLFTLKSRYKRYHSYV